MHFVTWNKAISIALQVFTRSSLIVTAAIRVLLLRPEPIPENEESNQSEKRWHQMAQQNFTPKKRAILCGFSFDFRCKIELDHCAVFIHHLLQVVHEGVHGGVMLRQVLPHLCGDGGGGRDRGDGRHVRRVRQRRHAPLRRRVRLVVHRAGGRAHPRVLEIHGRVCGESLEGKKT